MGPKIGYSLINRHNCDNHGQELEKQAETSHAELTGRLFLSQSGWLLLSVPNGLARGIFEALAVPGIELPEDFNAHISVMRPEDIAGRDISERGQSFNYRLHELVEISDPGDLSLSRVWALRVTSPQLKKLRISYGLSAEPMYPFHITVAIRKKYVLVRNSVSKNSSANLFERALSAQLYNPSWKRDSSVLKNIMNNLRQAQLRGVTMEEHRQAAERLKSTLQPQLGWKRLRDVTAGRRVSPLSPAEQFVFGN